MLVPAYDVWWLNMLTVLIWKCRATYYALIYFQLNYQIHRKLRIDSSHLKVISGGVIAKAARVLSGPPSSQALYYLT